MEKKLDSKSAQVCLDPQELLGWNQFDQASAEIDPERTPAELGRILSKRGTEMPVG